MTGDTQPLARPRARWSLLAILGGAVLVLARLFAAGSRVHLPNTPPPVARVLAIAIPCPIDANGDGVADVAARVLEGGTADLVLGLDGKNGRELWRSPSAEGEQMFCAGPNAIVMAAKGGGGRVLSPRDGKLLATLPSDPVVAAAGSADCFVVVGADQRRAAFDGHGAPMARCDAVEPPSNWDVMRSLRGTYLHVGGALVSVRPGRPAQPLVLNGYAGSAPHWTTPIGIDDDPRSLAMVPVGEGLLVAGHPVGQESEGHLVYVTAADGKIAYDEALPPTSNGHASFLQLTVDPGGRVILYYGARVVVFDAPTGAIAWTLGG